MLFFELEHEKAWLDVFAFKDSPSFSNILKFGLHNTQYWFRKA